MKIKEIYLYLVAILAFVETGLEQAVLAFVETCLEQPSYAVITV